MKVLEFFKTHDLVNLPQFQTQQAACFDLAFCCAGKQTYTGFTQQNAPFIRGFGKGEITFGPHERIQVPTGLIIDIPLDHSVRIHVRSSMAYKNGIVLMNQEGVIDSDYVDELFLLMWNTTANKFTIKNGDRLAQGELIRRPRYEIVETLNRPTIKTDRVGGLGSTGV